MKTYKISIYPKSGFASDLSSDIIFGHFCWAYRYLYGEEELLNLLNNFEEKPFILSSMMIEDSSDLYVYFPFYLIVNYNTDNSFVKKIKKQRYISLKFLKNHLNNFRTGKFFDEIKENVDNEIFPKDLIKIIDVPHNTIGRISAKVIEGMFFTDQEYFLNSNYNYCFFVKDSVLGEEKISEIMDYLESTGFGKDKSTGKGYFDYDIKDDDLSGDVENPNAFILLSKYIPKDGEEINGCYQIKPKIGRLGEEFAREKPFFKRPLFFIEEGALLETSNKKEYYGKILENVHINENIVHYGLGFPLFLKYEGEL